MTSTGFAYSHPWTYAAIMRLLHWGEFESRYTAVADLVAAGATVVDLCCGDAALASRLGHAKSYLGLDANQRFVDHAHRRGLDVRLWDARSMPIPPADVVVIQCSLYQFHPHDAALLQQAFAAANRRLIVAEPVVNWATHGKPWQKFLARRMTRVSGRKFDFRHDEATLEVLVRTLPSRHVDMKRAGRDLVIAIDK
jgi:hypothetical protein